MDYDKARIGRDVSAPDTELKSAQIRSDGLRVMFEHNSFFGAEYALLPDLEKGWVGLEAIQTSVHLWISLPNPECSPEKLHIPPGDAVKIFPP